MQSTKNTKYLLDSNILIYSLDGQSPFFEKSSQILTECIEGKRYGVIAQQNIVESISVLSRITKSDNHQITTDIKILTTHANLEIITPQEQTRVTFFELCRKLTGSKHYFDIYLAATMLDNNIAHIITGNDTDFENIPNINTINPFR